MYTNSHKMEELQWTVIKVSGYDVYCTSLLVMTWQGKIPV